MSADTFWGLSATAWTGIYTLLTAGLLLVAVRAALYAKRQWESSRQQIMETRRAELEARRPYIIVSVEPSEASRRLFDLVVKNIGQRPAIAVSILLDPAPVSAQEVAGHELSKAKMLNEPVAMIAPGQEMRAFYDNHAERNGRDDLPTSHKVSLRYRDSSGHTYMETSVIDINATRGTTFVSVNTIDDIGRSVAKIQETLSSASVLAREGHLEVEASIERRAQRQLRLTREQAERRKQHDRLVRRLRPGGSDTGQADEPT